MRLDGMLMVAGLVTWAAAAGPMAASYALGDPAGGAGLAQQVGWWAAWVVFGAAFCLQDAGRARPGRDARARVLLGVQVGAALLANGLVAMPVPGMPLGSVLCVVATARSVPAVAPAWGAALAAGQTVGLGVIYAAHGWPATPSVLTAAAFGGFSMFAWAVSALAERERSVSESLEGAMGQLRVMQAARERDARLDERLRLARDLHDGLGHHLAALSLRLEAAVTRAEPEAREQQVRAAREIAGTMLADLRGVVAAGRGDLGEDLRGMVERVGGGVARPRIEAEIAADLPEVDARISSAAFRIAQESLTNALRHADAGVIRVSCAAVDGALEVRVRDDGVGIAEANGEVGQGLRFMRERAEELGGAVRIERAAEGGTEVTARLPLEGGAA